MKIVGYEVSQEIMDGRIVYVPSGFLDMYIEVYEDAFDGLSVQYCPVEIKNLLANSLLVVEIHNIGERMVYIPSGFKYFYIKVYETEFGVLSVEHCSIDEKVMMEITKNLVKGNSK